MVRDFRHDDSCHGMGMWRASRLRADLRRFLIRDPIARALYDREGLTCELRRATTCLEFMGYTDRAAMTRSAGEDQRGQLTGNAHC
jgi:hypothetical protein